MLGGVEIPDLAAPLEHLRPLLSARLAASPPDLVAPLLFGPDGITGMARVHPDVYPGPNAALTDALFPPVRADLPTFYLP